MICIALSWWLLYKWDSNFFYFLPRMLHQDVQLVIELKILEGVLQANKVWKAELNVQKEVYSSAHVSMKKSVRKVNT